MFLVKIFIPPTTPSRLPYLQDLSDPSYNYFYLLPLVNYPTTFFHETFKMGVKSSVAQPQDIYASTHDN